MDYRRRRTDVVRLRLFMCFKGGSSIPRVHGPRYPNSAARQYSAFADQLLACFAPARASIPMSLALSLLIIMPDIPAAAPVLTIVPIFPGS